MKIYRFNCSNDSPSDKAVMILPGGGYKYVSVDGMEGSECAQFFNALGYDAIVVNYLTGEFEEVGFEDMIRRLKIVIKKVNIYSTFGLVGFSSGGHIAALCLNENISFGVITYAPLDFSSKYNHEASLDYLKHATSTTAQNILDISPKHQVTGSEPPVYIYHSILDLTVLASQSQLMHTKLVEMGVKSTLFIAERGEHGAGINSYKWKENITSFVNNFKTL